MTDDDNCCNFFFYIGIWRCFARVRANSRRRNETGPTEGCQHRHDTPLAVEGIEWFSKMKVALLFFFWFSRDWRMFLAGLPKHFTSACKS